MLPPGAENGGKQVRREIALVKREPDLDGEFALRVLVGLRIGMHRVGNAEMLDLPAIGVRADAEAAGRRQAGLMQPRQIRRLRAGALEVDSRRGGEGEDERTHTDALCFSPSWPDPFRPSTSLTPQ